MKDTITAAFAAAFLIFGSAHAGQDGPEAPDTDRAFPAQLAETLGELDFSGNILVSQGGEVVLRETVDAPSIASPQTMDADTRFPIASMTKSFTAALVLQLVDEDRLDLDSSLAELLPGFDVPYAGDVTLRHLLQNRSGIPHYIDIPGWFDNEVTRAFTDETFLAALEALELKFAPGRDYLYSNVNYYLLALIIDRHAGMTYEEVLQARILDPLGMTATGQIYDAPDRLAVNYLRQDDGSYATIPVSNPALFRGTASLYSTLGDLQAWGQAVIDGEVYSEAAAQEAFSDETPMAWDTGQLPLGEDAAAEVLFYNGQLMGYLSLILLLPERDGVVVVLNNNTAGYTNMLEIASILATQYFTEPG